LPCHKVLIIQKKAFLGKGNTDWSKLQNAVILRHYDMDNDRTKKSAEQQACTFGSLVLPRCEMGSLCFSWSIFHSPSQSTTSDTILAVNWEPPTIQSHRLGRYLPPSWMRLMEQLACKMQINGQIKIYNRIKIVIILVWRNQTFSWT
jgi:hypothetical protein